MTERTTRLVVVSAGLGEPSSTRLLADRLAAATARHAPAGTKVDTRVVDLRELAGDIAQNMVTGFPSPRLRDALDALARADGLIAATPVFTGSYSGLFKSFFDVVDRDALAGLPVLIAATGGTARHSLVLEHAMRPLFSFLRAVVVPTGVYAAPEDWASGGEGALAARVDRAAAELAGLLGLRSGAQAVAERRETKRGEAERGETGTGARRGTAHTSGGADGMTVVPFEEQLAALSVDE